MFGGAKFNNEVNVDDLKGITGEKWPKWISIIYNINPLLKKYFTQGWATRS